MRIITANVNGIRAANKKGFFEWLVKQKADVVCIQETKAQESQLDDPVFHPKGYYCYYFDAVKKGYSGVALYCKTKPDKVIRGLGWDHCDTEGRYIQADFGKLSIASLYLPSGSSSEERHNNKLDFMDRLMDVLKGFRRKKREYIICGDWNIIHKEIDIKNFKPNLKNSGVTQVEREWLDELFDARGYIDSFREINTKAEEYTWWSNRGQARANNVGWRIDYQVATPIVGVTAKKTSTYKKIWFSDHAPLTIDYDYTL